jgi:hypothetical protein
MIDVSIVIVNRNTREYLVRCIESIRPNTKEVSWEVTVVDNGSRDGTGTRVREKFPGVHLIENSDNFGFAAATNQGIRRSSGRYILLLNPDTQLREGAIEGLRSFMDSRPEAGVAGAQLLNDDGSKQNSIANFPSLATELLNKALLRFLFPKKFPGKERNYTEPVEVDSVIGACMMVRRQAVEQVGLLDESYFLFLEETEWCYRMKRAGWKIFHVPRVRIFHFQGKSAGKDEKRAKVEYHRSRYLFFKKIKGRRIWFLLLIGVTARLGIELGVAFLLSLLTLFMNGKLKRKLSTYAYVAWWHLKGCPEGMGLRPEGRQEVV